MLKPLLSLVFALGFSTLSHSAELEIPPGVVFDRDIEYGREDGEPLLLNLAKPKEGDALRPAVLCIHGGGFRAGTREGYNKTCLTLAANGFVAATVEYRLAPKFKFPAAVHDVKAAVRWFRANASKLGIDPNRIGVMGGSAGGHLAQFLGVTAGVAEFEGTVNPGFSSSVTCVANYYGPSDFTKSYGKSVDAHEVLPLWFGGNLEEERHLHVIGSPLPWVTPNAAPTLLIHGTEDPYVAHEQAVWMRDRLEVCGVEVELMSMQGAGHGFKGADAARADAAMLEFLRKHLR
jgi:acetyl esterase/lipase